MSSEWDIAVQVADQAPSVGWIRSLKAACNLELSQGPPWDPAAVQSHLPAAEQPSLSWIIRLLDSLRLIDSSDGSLSTEQTHDRVERVFDAARTLVDDGEWLQNQVVSNVPIEETLDLSLSLDNLVVAVTDLLHQAESSIQVLSPFFTIGGLDVISGPLRSAAERGVEITVFTRSVTQGGTQNADVLERLMESSIMHDKVTIYEYGPTDETGGTLHAKALIVDKTAAYVGSANLTHRGLQESLEIGVILHDRLVPELVSFTDTLKNAEFSYRLIYGSGEFQRV